MEREIRQLRAEVEALGPRGRGFRYAPDLQSRLTSMARRLREAGWSVRPMEEALSMRWETLRRWLSATEESAPSSVSLVPVEVVAERSLRVVSPSGYAVEGLDLREAAYLLRSLS